MSPQTTLRIITRPFLPLSLFATLALLLSGCEQATETPASQSPETQAQAQAQDKPTPALPTAEVKTKPVQAAKSPVHASTSSTLPNFASYTDVKQKKKAFFSYMLNLVKRANANVLKERTAVKQWDTSKAANSTISALVEKYRVEDTLSATEQKALLLKRVQVIPPSLVLAQGANESAWGTSRFARQGNNFFGQWCFSKGCGIVPSQRNDGAAHEVAKFDDPLESVESYIRNLNSHPTYRKLRDLRSTEMAKQGYPTGINLAAGLEGYSERGHEYIKEIRSMIRFNKLDQLDPDVLAGLKAKTQEG
jgi:Bax protein